MKIQRSFCSIRSAFASVVGLLLVGNISARADGGATLVATVVVTNPVPAWTPAQPELQKVADENQTRKNAIHLATPATVESLTSDLAEAHRQLAESRTVITNLTEKTETMQVKMRTLARNARFVLEGLRGENEKLNQELASRKSPPAPSGLDALAMEELQGQLAKLRAKLNVLEATPVPFTAEELALFRRPSAPALNPVTATNAPSALTETAAGLIREAQRLFAQRDFDHARTKYLEVLTLDPRNVYTLGNLATIELELDQAAAAEQHIQSALAIAPDDAFSLGVLGNLRFREGKYDLALDALSRAAELNPKDAEIQNFLGVTLSQKGQRAAAEAALRRAIQLDPEYGGAHNNLAVIYLSQTPPQVELARWHYQKAMAAGQGRNPDLETLIEKATQPLAPPRP